MIRKLMKDDRESFLEMAEKFYTSTSLAHPLPEETVLQNFAEAVSDNDFLDGYIIEIDSKVAGFAMITKGYSTEIGGKHISIEDIYVKPEFRGQGIGRSFFEFITAKYKDFKRFRLEVTPKNEGAIKLYNNLGFEEIEYINMKLDF